MRGVDTLRGIPVASPARWTLPDTCTGADSPCRSNTLVTADTLSDMPAIHECVRADEGTALESVPGDDRPRVVTAADRAGAGRGAGSGGHRHGAEVAVRHRPPQRRRSSAVRWRAGVTTANHARVPGAGMRDGNGIVHLCTRRDHAVGFLPLSAGKRARAGSLAIYRDSPLFVRLRDTAMFGGRCRGLRHERSVRRFARTRVRGDWQSASRRSVCPYVPPAVVARTTPEA